jgi:hypothetical protein
MVTLARVTLVFRLNIVGLTLTVVSTIAIELLKDKEWQTWFQSQPFRASRIQQRRHLVQQADATHAAP